MIDRLSPTARNVALFALFVLVGWFLWSVRSVLNPLILGYLLAFVVHPLVLRLERRGWKRRRAVNFIFGAFAILLTLLGLGIYFQGRGLARELASENGLGRTVRERLEESIDNYHDQISWVIQFLPKRGADHPRAPVDGSVPRDPQSPNPGASTNPSGSGPTAGANPSGANPNTSGAGSTTPDGAPKPEGPVTHASSVGDKTADLKRQLGEWWSAWSSDENGGVAIEMGSVGSAVLSLLGGVKDALLSFGVLLILLPIYTYFLLFELERIHRFVARYLPRRDRERLVRIGTQIGEVLATFFRGRLLVYLAKGAFLALGLAVSGVDYAVLIGFGTGFLSLIPFVGSAIGLVMALLVAMIEHSLVGSLVRVGIVFGAAEMLENYVLLPRILGNSLGLHPIVVIFSLMAGAASLGMFGLLIALPLTATLVILAREFLLPVLADLADNDRGPPRATPTS